MGSDNHHGHAALPVCVIPISQHIIWYMYPDEAAHKYRLSWVCKVFGFNPLYTGELFHCYIIDKSISHFRGVTYFVAFILLLWKILLAYSIDPDQMPHKVASDLGLHCYGFPSKNGLRCAHQINVVTKFQKIITNL